MVHSEGCPMWSYYKVWQKFLWKPNWHCPNSAFRPPGPDYRDRIQARWLYDRQGRVALTDFDHLDNDEVDFWRSATFARTWIIIAVLFDSIGCFQNRSTVWPTWTILKTKWSKSQAYRALWTTSWTGRTSNEGTWIVLATLLHDDLGQSVAVRTKDRLFVLSELMSNRSLSHHVKQIILLLTLGTFQVRQQKEIEGFCPQEHKWPVGTFCFACTSSSDSRYYRRWLRPMWTIFFYILPVIFQKWTFWTYDDTDQDHCGQRE